MHKGKAGQIFKKKIVVMVSIRLQFEWAMDARLNMVSGCHLGE